MDYPEGLSERQKMARCFKAAYNTAMKVGAGIVFFLFVMSCNLIDAQVLKRRVAAELGVKDKPKTFFKLAMDVLNNQEVKEQCKKMKYAMKTGITLDDVIDMIETCLL